MKMLFDVRKIIPLDKLKKKKKKDDEDANKPKEEKNTTTTKNNDSNSSFFQTNTFDALPDKYLDRYNVGDAIVTITHDYQYLVWEPQFKSISDKESYDKIMHYKQLIREDDSSVDQLMDNIKNAANDLGLSDVLARNYKAFEYYSKRDILGFEIIDVLMNDDQHLEDITCSNYSSVGVLHRDYLEQEVLRSNISFRTPEHMNVFLERIARMGGKHISSSEPLVDFHLGEKYRVAIISDDVISSPKSSALSIRLKSPKPFTITDMIQQNVIPASVVAVIWKMLDFRGTGLVIGGTGAGKSAMLNTLFPLLHKSSKIMTIEDAAELDIPQFDWTPLMIDVPIISPLYNEKFQEFLNAVLRHRPKMISVGEVRGKSTANLFDVMSTGHSSLASFHATTEQGAVNRIIHEFGVHPASFSQLWFILHVGIIIDKNKKHIRKCVSFDEVHFDDDGNNGQQQKINLINLCRYDAVSNVFHGGTISSMISKSEKLKYISRFDASSSQMQSDLEHRTSLLQECITQNAHTPKKVMEILSRYHVKKK